VVSTAAGYLIYFGVLARAANLLLVTFLIPPSAVLMGWAVHDGRVFRALRLRRAGK
jgi:hypothetical protein